jgi:peptide/nickel transport system permease protein
MLTFVGRRVVWSLPVLLLVTFLTFWVVRASTDPVQSYLRKNPRASPEQVASYVEVNGLSGSIPEQYVRAMKRVATLDLGRSIKGNRPVEEELRSALANTLVLSGLASLVGMVVGMGLGAMAARRSGSVVDAGTRSVAMTAISIPPFISSIFLQVVFAVALTRWLSLDEPLLPTSGVYPPGHQGFDPVARLRGLALPVLVLAIQIAGVYAGYMRAALLEVRGDDYIRTARAKGISERRVFVRHMMRNALMPVVSFAAIDVGAVVAGAIVTEVIFEQRGMGSLLVSSLADGDLPIIIPWVTIIVVSTVLLNLLADVMYGWLDPRARVT